MAINKDDFARDCVNQGLFLGVSPHFLLAVANIRSGIRDDSDAGGIGPFRFSQADWDAHLQDPAFNGSLKSADITDPGMQSAFAAVRALRAQESLLAIHGRYPSADELYQAWPQTPALSEGALQRSLDETRAIIVTAAKAALAGLDEEPVVGNIDLSSIAPGPRLNNAQLIVGMFGEAGYQTVHQIAALANAIAESNLNAAAVYSTPREHSVGLFQLNMNGGLGASHSEEQLKDPATNTGIIIKKAKTIKEFKAAINLHDAVSIFVRKIEQPANQAGEVVKRLAIAQKFLPSSA